MRKFIVSLAFGALALCAVPPANAAPAQTQTPIAAESDAGVQATDMSSHRRHWRRHHRIVRYYPRYYHSYGYYPEPYYYRPAPVVTFGFGFGGPHRHWPHW